MLLKDLCNKENIPCPKELGFMPLDDKWENGVYDGEDEGIHKWHVEFLTNYGTFTLCPNGDYEFLYFNSDDLEHCLYKETCIGDVVIQT